MLEYANSVWFPHTADGSNRLEGVQKSLGSSSTHLETTSGTHLLTDANMKTSETRARINILKHFFFNSRQVYYSHYRIYHFCIDRIGKDRTYQTN